MKKLYGPRILSQSKLILWLRFFPRFHNMILSIPKTRDEQEECNRGWEKKREKGTIGHSKSVARSEILRKKAALRKVPSHQPLNKAAADTKERLHCREGSWQRLKRERTNTLPSPPTNVERCFWLISAAPSRCPLFLSTPPPVGTPLKNAKRSAREKGEKFFLPPLTLAFLRTAKYRRRDRDANRIFYNLYVFSNIRRNEDSKSGRKCIYSSILVIASIQGWSWRRETRYTLPERGIWSKRLTRGIINDIHESKAFTFSSLDSR